MELAEFDTSHPGNALDSHNYSLRGTTKTESKNSNDRFPAGLRVLVVDDDPTCLFILDKMLRRCLYEVTTCMKATRALEMLRENKDKFDLVISDVYMPDMDGFKLLELVGLEMDLPVIMMSANGETSAVMKGITHGACDYLLKPVRMEELRNIWQHVVRKKRKELELSSSYDDKNRRFYDDGEHNSSGNDGPDANWKQSKKRKDTKEEEEEAEHDSEDPLTTKKPRVVWSVELHQQFVAAVNQLGIEKAVPKRILELMNVQGLTRENVASHLQKYRLYLKRISTTNHQQGNYASFPTASEFPYNATISGSGLAGLGELHAFPASAQLPPQALISLQAGLAGRLGSPVGLGGSGVDPSLLLKWAAIQGGGSIVRPPIGQSRHGNSQGIMQQHGNVPDPKHLVQCSSQLGSVGQQFGASKDKGHISISPLQQQQLTALSGGVGCSGQRVAVINSNVNNSLLMQPHQDATNLGLSVFSGESLAQHMLSNDIGRTRTTVPFSNVGSIVTSKCDTVMSAMGQVIPSLTAVSTPLSSPLVLGCQGTAVSPDYKKLNITAAGTASVHAPISCVPSSLTLVLRNNSRLKDSGSPFIGMDDQTAKAASQNFNAVGALGQRPNLDFGPGILGLNAGQDIVQLSNSLLSPGYGRALSSSPRFNVGSGQEQAQKNFDFMSQNMNISGNPPNGGMKNIPILQSHDEHSTADTQTKANDGSLGLITGLKIENGVLPEQLATSDDLLNFFLKKQQEGLGFSEGDFAADSYNALDKMFVK